MPTALIYRFLERSRYLGAKVLTIVISAPVYIIEAYKLGKLKFTQIEEEYGKKRLMKKKINASLRCF